MSQQNNEKNLNSALRKFTDQNRIIWDEFSTPNSELNDSVILVDCLVSFPPYILGTLIVAKYLQKWTNSRIIGLVRSQQDFEWSQRLLQSFSVETAFKINEQPAPNFKMSVGELLQEKDPNRIRELVLELSIDDMTIGDLIYDDYLRNTGLPTISVVDNQLLNYIRQAAYYFDVYTRLYNELNVTATVLGHTIYTQYGIAARISVQNGAPVYARKPNARHMAIGKISRLNEFNHFERNFSRKDFNSVMASGKGQAIKFSKEYIANKFRGRNTEGTTQVTYLDAYKQDKRNYSLKELADTLGLHPNKPNVFVMAHCFSDAPHFDEWMLHQDYYQWFEDTLSIIADIPHVNWIVKPHPADKRYLSDENHAALAVGKYLANHKHIFLAPDDLHSSCIADIADAILTVRGTAALEFSTLGIPCVVTGTISFTSYGFTIEPKSRLEYIRRLKNIQTLKKLSEEQITRAMVACYCYFYLNTVECNLIPESTIVWFEEFSPEKFWQDALQRINTYPITDDPLYKNLKIQFDNDLRFLVDFKKAPYLSPKDTAQLSSQPDK